MAWPVPDPHEYDSLLDLIEDAARRWQGREQMVLRTDEGSELPWSARDVAQHSKFVAWRLRELGLEPGDRLLTWSPSTPARDTWPSAPASTPPTHRDQVSST